MKYVNDETYQQNPASCSLLPLIIALPNPKLTREITLDISRLCSSIIVDMFVNICENNDSNKSSSFPLNGIIFREKNIVSKWKDLYKLPLVTTLYKIVRYEYVGYL